MSFPVHSHDSPSLKDRFLAPLSAASNSTSNSRQCPVFADGDWLVGGVRRVIDSFDSGRDFLQRFPSIEGSLCGYFDTLKSERRLRMVREVAGEITGEMARSAPDRLAGVLPCLDSFDVFAGDGHFHTHATHERRGEETKYAVGHLYGLNLRTKALVHLTCADQEKRKKEHDMRALKRLEIEELRQGAAKGRKTIWIWDRAGIDFRQWYKWKKGSGIYFVSRTKENMNTDQLAAPMPYDKADPANEGVTGDFLWSTSTGVQMRVVRFHDAATGVDYEFVTSLTDPSIPPGVIAQLYRMRWDIEKAFDDIKNKTREKKAWAGSSNAKSIQALLTTIAYNLMRMFEREMETAEGIRNEAEKKRQIKRREKVEAEVKSRGEKLPEIYLALSRTTQISVKFVRWLRYAVFGTASDVEALAHLRHLYSRI